MSTIRVTLTTYLTSEDQQQDWKLVKQHYGTPGDAATIRELIRSKAADIRTEIQGQRQEIQALREDVDSIKHLLRILCEKVGVAVSAA